MKHMTRSQAFYKTVNT